MEDEATKNTIYYNHALKEWASQKPILALGGILAGTAQNHPPFFF